MSSFGRRARADGDAGRRRDGRRISASAWRSGVWLPVLGWCLACGEGNPLSRSLRHRQEPVELPVLLTTDLPFRYPPALYAQQIPGKVTLQLFIDSIGLVVPESIRVAEPSKYAAFDSSALEGAARLIFRPARRGDHRIPYTVLFPIRFQVPGGPAPTEDTAGRSR